MIPIKKVEVDGIGYKISGVMEGFDHYRIIVNSEPSSIVVLNAGTDLATLETSIRNAIDEFKARKSVEDAFVAWDGTLT